jgi:hypothetical protein
MTTTLSACFGSEYLIRDFQAIEQSILHETGSSLRFETNLLPMASVLTTPNVVYEQDESGLYFYAFFNGFYTLTCLEGEYYGFQVFFDDNDESFAVSDNFHFEELDGEEMMVHEYNDGQVFTGKAIQIIHID